MLFRKRKNQRPSTSQPLLVITVVLLALVLIPTVYTLILKPDQTEAATWNFDEGYGGSVKDQSSSSNTANVTGPTWKNEDLCRSGKCLYFDGTDDYVNTSNTSVFDAGSAFTIMLWVKPTLGGEAATETVLAKTGVIEVNLSDTNDQVIVSYPGNSTSASSLLNSIKANQWQHIAVTHNGTGTIAIYINGINQTDDNSVTDTDSAAETVIGAETAGSASQNFQGFIDTVKIMTSVLTTTQIVGQSLSPSETSSGVTASFGSDNLHRLNDELIGYWSMNESSWTNNCSTSSVLDLSGNNNHGTACPNSTGPAGGAAGKYGNSADLDGSDDYVNLGTTAANVTNNFTLSAWIKIDSTDTGTILSRREGGTTQWQWLAEDNGGNQVIRLYDGSQNFDSAASTVRDGNWHHVVTVVSSLGSQHYIDGNRSGNSFVPNISAQSVSTFIGARGDGGGGATFFLDGKIDELRVYNRTLSEKEVQQLFHWSPQPVAYLPLDENSGTTNAYDVSGSNLTGTLGGSMTETDWVPGVYGSALEFDGVDDVITVSDQATLDISSGLTLSLWVNDPPPEPGDEIVEKRTINSKTTFLRNESDGSKSYTLSTALGPVHYKDDLHNQQEQWKDIDTNVIEADGEYQFVNQTNLFKSFFKKKSLEENVVKYQNGQASISYTLRNNELGTLQESAATNEKNSVTYPLAYPNVDVRFSVQNIRLLEEFVLHQYQPVERITQEITIEHAYYEQQPDGSYLFFDKDTHEQVWSIAAPVMYEDQKYLSIIMRFAMN